MNMLLRRTIFFYATNRKNKSGRGRVGPGIAVRRYGGKHSLARYIGAFIEVDLDAMRPK